MADSKRLLNDKNLEEVTGGYTYNDFKDPSEITFLYPKGYQCQICDCIGLFSDYHYTHTGTVTKRGYYYLDLYNVYECCYYFDGDSDIAGWYPECYVDELATRNYADSATRGCYKNKITQVD